MIKKGLYTVLISLFLCGLSFGSETDYEKKMARGVSALEFGTYDEAAGYFGDALAERPGDRQAALYRAIALSRGKKEGAEESLIRVLSNSPDDPRANLEMGIFYYGNGMAPKAAGYFQKTVELSPGSDIAAMGREYLDALKGVDSGKAWRINLWSGVQYDSNVVLGPDNAPLPQGISRKSDWRAILYFDGAYRFFQGSGLECSVGYGLYQSLHHTLSDFNVTDSLLTLTASYEASPSIKLGAVYLLDYARIGGDGYYTSHNITPSVSIAEGRDLSTVIEYRYRGSHFLDSGLFQGNSERSGSNNAFGIMQTARLGEVCSGRIGYGWDEDSTRRDYWDYRGDRGFAGLTLGPVKDTTLDLNGEYYRKKFKGPDPLSAAGDSRKDDIYSAAVSVQRRLSGRITLLLGYIYMRNRSNIDAFDYSRSIGSLMLSARF